MRGPTKAPVTWEAALSMVAASDRSGKGAAVGRCSWPSRTGAMDACLDSRYKYLYESFWDMPSSDLP